VRALRELRQLQREGLIAQKAYKAYYSRLSWILRAYFENRFLFPALEQTTTELMARFGAAQELDDEQQRWTRAILEQADLVKFARFIPEADDARQVLELAFRIVEQTKIVSIEEVVDKEERD